MTEGVIIKTLADLFFVQTEGALVPCKARGVFRNTRTTPLVGDRVLCSQEGRIEKILPRKNFLERPAVANIDRLYIIVSAADPLPVPLMIDRLTAIAFDREIQPVLVLNKTDLAKVDWLIDIYKTVPMPIITACAQTGQGVEELRASLMEEGVSVFSGNSGVGKSSLLNAVDPNLTLATGVTSKKLGRGKHTTRHVELYQMGKGLVADTPGFSSLDMERVQWIYKENLVFAFPELLPFKGQCRFSDCKHIGEKDCAVDLAVKEGKISQSRLDSYRTMYKEADAIKDWQRKK